MVEAQDNHSKSQRITAWIWIHASFATILACVSATNLDHSQHSTQGVKHVNQSAGNSQDSTKVPPYSLRYPTQLFPFEILSPKESPEGAPPMPLPRGSAFATL